VAEYRLLTIWRIEAPLKAVYAAILDPLRWPDWWPDVHCVKQLAAGDADGIDSVCRYSWKGKLPYELVFEVRATCIENLVAIEGIAQGDLEGIGRWVFSVQGTVSVVCFEWHVRSNRWWMNLIAPLARSMFIRNHARVMKQGGEGLARLLGSPLVGLEHIDLMVKTDAPSAAPERLRGLARIDPAMILVAGLGAGAIACFVQFALWWLANMPLSDTLFRNARPVAALVMGTDVLPPPSTPQWNVFLVATGGCQKM
jgi:hypothetical protein